MRQIGQVAMGFDQTTVVTGLVSGAASVFLLTVVLGALAVGVAPGYTYRVMATVSNETIRSMLYGTTGLLGVILVALALAMTVIEGFLVVPLLLFAVALWALGAAIAGTVIGGRLVGMEDGLLRPLLLGAAVNAVLVLTGIGVIGALAIGATGFGAILRSGLE